MIHRRLEIYSYSSGSALAAGLTPKKKKKGSLASLPRGRRQGPQTLAAAAPPLHSPPLRCHRSEPTELARPVRTVAVRPPCSTLARTWAGAVALLR
jgi:hypothetical protein